MDKESFIKLYGENEAVGLLVHKNYCSRCPSHPTRRTDPEAAEFLKLPKELRMLTVFPCAWRRKKLCKGHYEDMQTGRFREGNTDEEKQRYIEFEQ